MKPTEPVANIDRRVAVRERSQPINEEIYIAADDALLLQ